MTNGIGTVIIGIQDGETGEEELIGEGASIAIGIIGKIMDLPLRALIIEIGGSIEHRIMNGMIDDIGTIKTGILANPTIPIHLLNHLAILVMIETGTGT